MVRRENAMTWHKDGNRVGAASAANRARGLGPAKGRRHFGITLRSPGRDTPERAPNALLKRRAFAQIERRQPARRASGQRVLQRPNGDLMPVANARGNAVRRFRALRRTASCRKIQAGQSAPGIMREESAVICLNGQLCFHKCFVSLHTNRAVEVLQICRAAPPGGMPPKKPADCDGRAFRSAWDASPECFRPRDN
jgi:hypothetical protein